MTGDADIARAAELLRRGKLVALPTETVYGLAGDATNDRAVASIYEAKGRPSFNPLIVHVTGVSMAKRHGEFSPLALKLGEAFWPGPLTLVLPRRRDSGVSLLVSAGLDTVALRAPASGVAQRLIASCGFPLAAPSANPSGRLSPTTAQHVMDGLGDKVAMVLDGGPSPVGVESTIVKIDGEKLYLLRPGGLARAEIERIAGTPLQSPIATTIEAPGMLASHYAPQAKIRLNAKEPGGDEAFLGFGAVCSHGAASLNLSKSGDLVEAAANLFAYIRRLDAICTERGLHGIAVAAIPAEGLGEAINDRLARAAAPRS